MSNELLYELTYILCYNFQYFKILIPISKSSGIWCSYQWRMLLATKLPTKSCLNNKKMLSHVIRTSEVRSLWRWFQWLNSVRILSGRLYIDCSLIVLHSSSKHHFTQTASKGGGRIRPFPSYKKLHGTWPCLNQSPAREIGLPCWFRLINFTLPKHCHLNLKKIHFLFAEKERNGRCLGNQHCLPQYNSCHL